MPPAEHPEDDAAQGEPALEPGQTIERNCEGCGAPYIREEKVAEGLEHPVAIFFCRHEPGCEEMEL